MVCEMLDTSMHVSTPVGDLVAVDQVYRIFLLFMGYQTWDDLVILHIVDFDIILGMSWLSLYHVILDYHTKIVIVAMQGIDRF